MGTQVSSAKNGNSHENSDLMRAMGSESGSWDPIPPYQRTWQLSPNEPTKHRIWAWMLAHTVAAGKKKAYATGEKGAALTVRHLAADLGMEPAEASHAFRSGVRAGLWRYGTEAEGKERLYLCAQPPPAAESADNSYSEEYQTLPSSEVVYEKGCTTFLPCYILKKTKDWDSKDRDEFTERWVALLDLEKRVNAAAMAAAREVMRGLEDRLLAEYGFPSSRQLQRKNGETDEQAAERRRRVEPLLPLVLEVALASPDNLGQPAEKGCTTSAPNVVQPFPPLVYSHYTEGSEMACGGGGMGEGMGEGSAEMPQPSPKTSPSEEKPKPQQPAAQAPPPSGVDDGGNGGGSGGGPSQKSSAIAPTFEQEVEAVRLSLVRFGRADKAGARRLLRNCRRNAPGCTTAEVVAFIDQKAERFQSGRVDHPVGFLIASVPDCFEGDYRALLAEAPPGPPGMSPELRRDMQRIQETVEIARAMRKRRGLV
jgi:hypothetical protein